MPVLDGLEATRRLRQSEALRDVIVIAVSASAYGHHREQYLAAGADDFLSKPFQLEELLELLRARLGLELVYASGGAGSPASDNAPDGEIIAPPGAELAVLRELAQRGDLRNLLAQVERLERADGCYAPFAAQLRSLAERFQIKKINELLAGASSSS